MSASPFHNAEEPGPIADVNVVPLADVSLVLLIILLVLSPMAAQSMLKVQAAAARADAAPPALSDPALAARPPEPVLAVGVSAAGFTLGDRTIGTGLELREALAEKLKSRDDRKVFVSPELEARHGRVVEALEAVQAAGGTAALVQVADPGTP